jgi:hypothetical protein
MHEESNNNVHLVNLSSFSTEFCLRQKINISFMIVSLQVIWLFIFLTGQSYGPHVNVYPFLFNLFHVVFSDTPALRILLTWFHKREPMLPWFAKRTRKRGRFRSLESLWYKFLFSSQCFFVCLALKYWKQLSCAAIFWVERCRSMLISQFHFEHIS